MTPTLAINEQDSGGIPESHGGILKSIFDSTTRDNINTARAFGLDETTNSVGLPEPKYIASINAGVDMKCQTPNYERDTVDQDSLMNASKHYTDDSMSKIQRG